MRYGTIRSFKIGNALFEVAEIINACLGKRLDCLALIVLC
jgi:hypothetical protein